jgi:hypothetical protein
MLEFEVFSFRHCHGGEIASCYPGTKRYTIAMMFLPGFLEIHK